MQKRSLLPLVVVVALSGCSKKSEPEASSAPEPTAPTMPTVAQPKPQPPPSATHEVTWTDPAGWDRIAPSSAMRKATYKIHKQGNDPEDAEMAVFYFGAGEGGSTEANIQRWIGQFGEVKPADVKRSERSPHGLKQTLVELEGTFASGMPGQTATPRSNYRLIGAVVETPAGSYFFKLTGPNKTVQAARDAFFSLLDSVKST